MWWRNSRVALGHAFRFSVVFALAGLCAACFQPLYATKSITGERTVGAALAQVQIDRVPAPNGTPDSRIAVEIQNQLDFELILFADDQEIVHPFGKSVNKQEKDNMIDAVVKAARGSTAIAT